MHPYLPVLVFFLGGLAFVGIGFGVSKLLQKANPGEEKGTFYESGEEPAPGRGARFNIRYFLPAALFLLFEVEMVLLAPVLLSRKSPPEGQRPGDWEWLVRWEVLGFVILLLGGFLWALGSGYFQWDKPEIKAPDFNGPVPDFVYEQYNLDQERREKEAKIN